MNMRSMTSKLRHLVVALGAAALLPTAANAASVMSAQWFRLLPGHPDTQLTIDGLQTGLVNTTLGPNGLPVRSATSAAASAGSSRNFKDIDAITNELLWWTPRSGLVAVDAVRQASTPTIAEPFPGSFSSGLFPGNASGNGGNVGFTTAIFSGVFNLATAGTVSGFLGADDDAWMFINGQLVADNGGVKAIGSQTNFSTVLAAGNYRVDIFFADRHTVQSGIKFDINQELAPIPEPSTYALMLAGLLALGWIAKRRSSV